MVHEVESSIKDQQLVQDRQAQIVAAATRMFLEQGYGQTSVNDVARQCDMSVGSLYRYVKTKEDILYLICKLLYNDLDQHIAAEIASIDDPVEKLVCAVRTYFNAVEKFDRNCLLTYREFAHLPADAQRHFMDQEDAVARLFSEIIEAGNRIGVFDCCEPRVVAHNILTLAHMWVLKAWALRPVYSMSEYTKLQIDLLLKSLNRKEK